MTDHSAMKLGKGPKRHDVRTLKLAKYIDLTVLPALPPDANWYAQVSSWGMMLNDKYGCCTAAGAGHVIVQGEAYHNLPFDVKDADVLQLYETVTGQEGAAFDPATGANDNGCVELDVLNYWRQSGIAGHRLGAYATIDPGHTDHLKAAIAFLGGAYVGIQLPVTAQGQDVWDVPPGGAPLTGNAAPGSWGGHCVILVGYDETGLYCVTWGAVKRLTWAWWRAYSDEAYALLSNDWVTGNGEAPSGFNLDQLTADLAAI